MYIRNYNKNLNIAESTSLQNVTLAVFILAFLEGPLRYAKISTPVCETLNLLVFAKLVCFHSLLKHSFILFKFNEMTCQLIYDSHSQYDF